MHDEACMGLSLLRTRRLHKVTNFCAQNLARMVLVNKCKDAYIPRSLDGLARYDAGHLSPDRCDKAAFLSQAVHRSLCLWRMIHFRCTCNLCMNNVCTFAFFELKN